MATDRDDPMSVIGHFVPDLVSPERFARVESLVRDAVLACAPSTAARARDLLRYAGYLAAWGDSQYLPLRTDVLFAPQTIEDFVATLDAVVPARSAATIAATLRSMGKVVGPGGEAERRGHPAPEPKVPYNASEIETLFDLAGRSRSAKRRHDLAALLVLGLGAGARGQESARVRPSDVVRAPGGLRVSLRRLGTDGHWRERCAEVLPDYVERLVGLARTDATYLLGGGRSRHSRVYDLCDHSRGGTWPVALDAARLRATYLVEIASVPHRAADLLRLAGVQSFEVFDHLRGFLRTGPPA